MPHLAVGLLLVAIHLEHAHAPFPVDLFAWGMLHTTLAQVPDQLRFSLEEVQRVLADVQHLKVWIRGSVFRGSMMKSDEFV